MTLRTLVAIWLAMTVVIATACGQGSCSTVVGFCADVTGHSNDPCVVQIDQDGGASQSFSIGSPTPPVATTSSVGARAPINATTTCTDGGSSATVSPTLSATTLCRSPSQLCVTGGADKYFNASNSCSGKLTLTCGGSVLYDHVAVPICACAL